MALPLIPLGTWSSAAGLGITPERCSARTGAKHPSPLGRGNTSSGSNRRLRCPSPPEGERDAGRLRMQARNVRSHHKRQLEDQAPGGVRGRSYRVPTVPARTPTPSPWARCRTASPAHCAAPCGRRSGSRTTRSTRRARGLRERGRGTRGRCAGGDVGEEVAADGVGGAAVGEVGFVLVEAEDRAFAVELDGAERQAVQLRVGQFIDDSRKSPAACS